MAYSEKQKKKIVQKIRNLYASGKYPIESCCKHLGITYRTYRKWDKELQEVQGIGKVLADRVHKILNTSYEQSGDETSKENIEEE